MREGERDLEEVGLKLKIQCLLKFQTSAFDNLKLTTNAV